MIKIKLRHAFAAVLAVSFMSLAPANADYAYDACCQPDPCNSCCDMDWCGGFEIGVDFIYWKPCVDDLHYAISADLAPAATNGNVSNSKYKYVDPCWQPGVRAYLKKTDVWCDWNLLGSYTYIHSTDSDRCSSSVTNGLQSTLLHAGIDTSVVTGGTPPITAKATYKLKYNTFDVLLAKDYCCCPCQTLTPFFGVEWVCMDQMLNHKLYSSDTTPVALATKWESDFWGVGLKMGSLWRYDVCDCFGIFAKASGSLLTGSHCDTNTQRRPTTVVWEWKLKDDECLCVPGWHIAVGLDYTDCWCGWDVTGRIGYEFLQWHNMPTPRRFYGNNTTDDFGQSTSPTTSTIGFHGLLVGLSLAF